jgi:tRNA-Thr(GGU) m(6)t(6)A37 methyltransferase TsaA
MKSAKKIEFEIIGHVETCFKEKFGIPRQPGIVSEARGIIRLRNEDDYRTAIRTLDGFSHVWVIFVFHEHGSKNWKPSIRPPRLGGAKKVGVLASRSPHRPNPIGLSAFEIEKILVDAPHGPEIHVRGVDLLDGTPVLDIKPYLPYADSIPKAKSAWAEPAIPRTEVHFTPLAEISIAKRADPARGYANLKNLITELLEIDPRPAFQKRKLPPGDPRAEETTYGFNLFEFDVKWKISNGKFVVTDLVDL